MPKRYAIALLGLISMAALYAGGCAAPARRPAPGDEAPPGNNGGNVSSMPEEISKIVRSRMQKQQRVETIVVGNIAVVGLGDPDSTPTPGPDTPGLPPGGPGLDRKPGNRPVPTPPPPTTTPPPGGAPRPGAPGSVTTPPAPPPAGSPGPIIPYTPRAGSTGVVDQDIAREITRRFPQLVRIYSTNDPVLVSRIASVARDVKNRRPIDRRINEIAFIVSAVSGPPIGGPPARTPPGTPAP